jgi:hypothetical protein
MRAVAEGSVDASSWSSLASADSSGVMAAVAARSESTPGVAVMEAIVIVSVVHHVVEMAGAIVLDWLAAVHKEEAAIVVF